VVAAVSIAAQPRRTGERAGTVRHLLARSSRQSMTSWC
jgi:hypothetical protein